MDACSIGSAIRYDKICVVNSEELAIELKNILLSELNYARENNLIKCTSNYDGREEDIIIELEKQPIFSSLDEIYQHPGVILPRWL
jgi:hypothetical protein